MTRYKVLHTTLVDQINHVGQSFSEYAEGQLRRGKMRGFCDNALHYDGTEFVGALVKEIFTGPGPFYKLGDLMPSTQVLIRDGMEPERATKLALETFQLVTDYIGMYLPTIAFCEADDINIDLIEGGDLTVSALNMDNDP